MQGDSRSDSASDCVRTFPRVPLHGPDILVTSISGRSFDRPLRKDAAIDELDARMLRPQRNIVAKDRSRRGAARRKNRPRPSGELESDAGEACAPPKKPERWELLGVT